ncbi:MAG: SDR family oxidoreductase [Erysipelotrichaceae bacterium]|nr:SDR family oxidoreductase [Erysipelotrichaceae bacterium]
MKKRICLVTGASGDIGRKITAGFLKKGCFVVMIASNADRLEKTVNEEAFDPSSVMILPMDISDEKSVIDGIRAVRERFGTIDFLVNAAGICGEYALTQDYSYEGFRRIYEINVFGTFLMIKYTLPLMLENGKGSIVNIASVSGMMGYTYEAGYGSSKWAVIGLTKNVANEYGGRGVRCNSVSPGWVRSSMMEKTAEDYRKLDAGNIDEMIHYGSIHRCGEPDEIADAVCFLCSDEAAYINGANIPVDGGMTVE